MEAIRIKGGHRFRVSFGHGAEKRELPSPKTVGIAPRGYDLKFKVTVKEGDAVKRGDSLFHDKKNPNVKFTAPAGGTVKEVRYGSRRKLLGVVIDVAENEEAVDFGAVDAGSIGSLGESAVAERMVNAGLWTRVRSFPGWRVAPVPGWTPEPDMHGHVETPPKLTGVYVSALATEPHLPDPLLALEGNEEMFAAGLEALKQLAPNLHIFVKQGAKLPSTLSAVSGVKTHAMPDKYPAENVGVQLWYTKPAKKGEVVATVTVEDVLDIGHLFLKGNLRTERLYAVAGKAAKKRGYVKGRIGQPVKDVAGDVAAGENRFIAGGVFSGLKVGDDDFMAPGEHALQVMPEDRHRTPFHFQGLGLNRFSLFKLWPSGFMPNVEREATTSNWGEERACVQCSMCIDVCPVELMPNIVFKAALANDIEKMESVGIHDCADCGLCTFICPSKIELGQIIEDGKTLIAKEG